VNRCVVGAIAICVAVLMVACGGRSVSSEQTAAASSPTAVTLTPLAQGLTLSGHVAGAMSSGTGDCRVGRPDGQSLFQVTVIGTVGSSSHSVRMVAQAYAGPGTYTPDAPRRATFTLDGGAGSAGTLVVDDGEVSGSMDAELVDGQRVSGTWACTTVGG
jgi:hypothetical protein